MQRARAAAAAEESAVKGKEVMDTVEHGERNR
jgi:hypothetical protein